MFDLMKVAVSEEESKLPHGCRPMYRAPEGRKYKSEWHQRSAAMGQLRQLADHQEKTRVSFDK